MPTHPLRDLAWQVDELLRSPEARQRFISQCTQHLRDLDARVPRGSLAKIYERAVSGGPLPDGRLGWLTAHDDENVLLPEMYAILGALRECVYKGPDKMMPWPIDGSELADLYASGGMSAIWGPMIEAVRNGLTEEHRSHVESWLRDVRLDLTKGTSKAKPADRRPNRKPRKKPKSSGPRAKRPLTKKQQKVVDVVVSHQGNMTKAAEELGVKRQSVSGQYHVAMKKLEKLGVELPSIEKPPVMKKRQLPTDRRGQATVEDRSESD